jgi:hypothetical protein
MSRCRSDFHTLVVWTQGMDAQVPDFAGMFHTFHTFHTSFLRPREGARTRTHVRAHAHAHPTLSVWKVWKVWKSQQVCGSSAPHLCHTSARCGT